MESQTVEIKEPELSLEERKAQLLRQGEFYRVGLVHAMAQLKHAARPETLIHSAIDHATWALRTRVDSLLRPTGSSVASLMPYAMAVIGFIRSRRMGKASLGVALALAAAGFFLRKRQARQAAF
ncbi:MAG: hypothetical protein JWP34_4442 [Massilia sp.]|nr:hypothetical protein [Massilia sp.]